MSSHSEQLKHKDWQRRRLEIFQRDNFTCQSSGCDKTNNTLEVHHVDYFSGKKLWEYPDDMLITLCHKCYNKEQNRESLETGLATCLKMKGFLVSDLMALQAKLYTDDQFTYTLLQTLRKMQNG